MPRVKPASSAASFTYRSFAPGAYASFDFDGANAVPARSLTAGDVRRHAERSERLTTRRLVAVKPYLPLFDWRRMLCGRPSRKSSSAIGLVTP
jgi:hypothetical protein